MQRGSITVYLSLILVSVLLLISIIAESARINVVHTESKSYTYMAADSVLAGYARQVYKDYGILLVWEKEPLKEQLKKYIQANINMADLSIYGSNFMTTRLQDININKVQYVSDKGGELFIEQIASYIKYNKLTDAANKILDLFNKNEQEETIKKVTKASIVDEKQSNKLKDRVEQITDKIESMKEKELSLSNSAGRLSVSRKVNRVILLIKKYQEERKEFLKQEGLQVGKDYMDENLVILEQVKDKLEEYKLNDSNNKQNASKLEEEIKEEIKKLKVCTPSKKDEKNKSIYESAKELIEKGILSLVIEDVDNISSSMIPDSNLPSNLIKEKSNSLSEELKNKAVLAEYGGQKFGNYTNVFNENYLSYEMEYIINGNESDRSNLTETIKKITTVRNIQSFTFLLLDNSKQLQVTGIASSVATAIALPFLEPVIKTVLNEAWALAEAINDVKILLKGKKIDLLKNKENWNTDLQSLLKANTVGSDKKSALDYKQICQLLIVSSDTDKVIYRIMDLIQFNVQKKYNPKFEISKCFQSFEFCADFQTEPLFSAMPWTIDVLGEKVGAHNFSIQCKDKY